MLDRPVMMVYQQMALLPNISMQSVTPEHIYIYIYIKKMLLLGLPSVQIFHICKTGALLSNGKYMV